MTNSARTLNAGIPPSLEQKATALPLSQPPLWRALRQGLTLAHLQAAGCFAEPPPTPTPGALR